jgi:hypothetical protein
VPGTRFRKNSAKGTKIDKKLDMKRQGMTSRLATYGFKKIYDSIDQYGIKKGVDTMGLDKYIKHCARLAGSTGAITGMGGAVTMIVGIPVDLFNLLTQQFRVTLGVIYDRRGSYSMTFEEFMSVIAVSVGLDAGMIATRSLLESVAEKLLIRMGESAAGRLIPVVGAVVGGATNYLFIKSIGASMKKLPFKAADPRIPTASADPRSPLFPAHHDRPTR